jgi:DNA helicase-2/ATP-dependent DNA helicase PcrA
MPNLLENLNPEQLAAVTLPPQHALVLAGAGSGKTRVLTTRIAWLISTGNVSPHGLIAVTFTNKAAREMLTRISAMLPINMRGMWIGTFHGLCNRLLRAHHRDAGLPQTFTILDSADQLAVVKRVMKAMNVDEERFPPRQVQYFIAAAKEEGKRAGAVEVYDEFTRKYAEIYAAYDALCNKEGSVDFAELLLRSFELLTANEPLRTHYQNRFRHVLVDEFQDTNRLQYRWLKLLTGPETALFAVGDDDQSIYRFRGANVGNMADFERDYRVKNLIRLEQNYRSYGNILKAANALIAHNAKRLGKNLWTESGEGEPIRVYEATSDVSESSWLVEEIQALVRDGLSRRDIAILYRSNAQSRVLEHALFSAGISYRVYGGLRFFERTEIKHALAYLRLVANPDDDAAFLRVVNFPTRGIGARTLEQVQDAAAATGTSLWAAAQRAGGKVAGFVRIIEKLRADTAGLPLPEVVDHMLEASGLVAHYRTERDGADRVDNLNELVNAAAGFMHEEGLAGAPAFNLAAEDAAAAAAAAPDGAAAPAVPADDAGAATGDDPNVAATPADPLAAFLAHAALESGENQAGEGSDAVQMMTVHSAKGLEFHVVFVTGLEEGLFPHEQSVNEDDGLEEERRLMYVAITRARTRLYVSFAQTRMLHGQTRYNVASRFLDELPAGVLKWLTAQKGRFLGNDAWASAGPPTGYRPKETAAGIPYRIGQSVTHPKFGQGVIVSAEGSGSDARVQINFGAQGMKWLALEYAKLTPA